MDLNSDLLGIGLKKHIKMYNIASFNILKMITYKFYLIDPFSSFCFKLEVGLLFNDTTFQVNSINADYCDDEHRAFKSDLIELVMKNKYDKRTFENF